MIIYDYDEETGQISVLTQTELGNHREVLVPGQFDRARTILTDDLYTEIEMLWTPEIIQAYKQLISDTSN